MGRSAKVHKRGHKKPTANVTSSTGTESTDTSKRARAPQPPRNGGNSNNNGGLSGAPAKRRKDLKTKSVVQKSRSAAEAHEHVLGGADYVTLMLGGRRKAQEEAKKFPSDNSTDRMASLQISR